MLSVPKLLLLALVISAVWFGWRWVRRVEEVGRARRERRPGPRPAGGGGAGVAFASGRAPAAGYDQAEDMEKCPECAAYVAPHSAVACGRPGCPYGR